ncbi:MAG: TetR/AcrR family transcriptional regulator [Deltaproteobacteria bacterium]|nr:TetR/AcrR family transcriptional regulator [Deltaproteobacteria bacterium]
MRSNHTHIRPTHRRHGERQELDTESRIISAATQLFARNGYDATSTKEICGLAAVNIAAIHYHFGSKEGLLRCILESCGATRTLCLKGILLPPTSAADLKLGLRQFLDALIGAFLDEPDLWRVAEREYEFMHSRSEEVLRKTLLKQQNALAEFLSQARRRRLVAREIDPRFAARMLLSHVSQHTRFDLGCRKSAGSSLTDPKVRSRWVDQSLCIFLNGISETQ